MRLKTQPQFHWLRIMWFDQSVWFWSMVSILYKVAISQLDFSDFFLCDSECYRYCSFPCNVRNILFPGHKFKSVSKNLSLWWSQVTGSCRARTTCCFCSGFHFLVRKGEDRKLKLMYFVIGCARYWWRTQGCALCKGPIRRDSLSNLKLVFPVILSLETDGTEQCVGWETGRQV